MQVGSVVPLGDRAHHSPMDLLREMPLVYRELERWILDNADPDDAKRFGARWRRVRPGMDRLPCPNCFLEGEDQPLAPMDIEKGVLLSFRPWSCAHCSERFDVPIEET
jgi:hypothetical protein